MTHLEDLQEEIATAELPDKEPCMSRVVCYVEAHGTQFYLCEYHAGWFDEVAHPYYGEELCCKA